MYIKYLFIALFSILFMSGCSSKSSHNDQDSDHEHNATVNLSAYTASYEVYVVADPFVSGHEGHILVHVTRLSDFKPAEKVEVSASLSVGGKKIIGKMHEQHTPGLYILGITPTGSGEATLYINIKNRDTDQSATFTKLTVYTNEHEADEAAKAQADSHPNSIAFPKEKSWNTDFATTIADYQEIGSNVRSMALVEPAPAGERTLAATVAGKVTVLDPHLAIGSQIQAGKSLFRIDASGVAEGDMKLRIADAQAEYARAKREYDRINAMMADKLATAAELSQARADYERAAALISSLRKNFGGGAQSVSSPIAGFLRSIDVTNGQWVEAGQPLATVASSSMLQLTARIPSRYAADLKNISGAMILTASGASPIPLGELNGRILSHASGVEAGSAMLPIVMEISNSLDLIPGTYVETLIRFGRGKQSVAVPRSAIVEEMGSTFVMVQINPELFEKRQVTLGSSDGYFYEVISGLRPGERIVSKGAPIVKLSQGAGTLDAHSGHAH